MRARYYIEDEETDRVGLEIVKSLKELKKDVDFYSVYKDAILDYEIPLELKVLIQGYIRKTEEDFVGNMRGLLYAERDRIDNILKKEEETV